MVLVFAQEERINKIERKNKRYNDLPEITLIDLTSSSAYLYLPL